MNPQELDFTVVNRAGLTQKEFASLAGVSRVTTNTWVRGKMKPHRYIRARAEKFVALLERAVECAALPLPVTTRRLDRPFAIKEALRKAAAPTT